MKILVTGVGGQLGHDVMNELAARGYDAIGSDIALQYSGVADESPVTRMPYMQMDITDAQRVANVLGDVKPDAVMHCAAWTAVDLAEEEKNRDRVRAINAEGTRYIAEQCRKLGCKLMYISTDYVFNGQGTRPWEPDDEREPLNAYGRSKYEGELAIEELLEKYFTVRIAWVFGLNGKNFIKTMLRLGKERGAVSVVDDQIGSPTYTYDLARLLVDMIQTDRYGRYHATNEGLCSWYEFACEIFRQAGMDEVKVTPVDSASYPAKAKRPFNSRMSKEKLTENGFERLPSWQDALGRYLKVLSEAE